MRKISIIIFCLILSDFIYCQIAKPSDNEITNEKIWLKGTFTPKTYNSTIDLNDGIHYCIEDNESLIEYEYKTGNKTKILLDFSKLIPEGKDKAINVGDYQFSDDCSKLLISTEAEKIYRYSTKSIFYIWDFQSSKLTLLSSIGKIRLAEFSPDAKKVAFVFDNNIYIKDLTTNKEEQITKDGSINNIINGNPDWVYEEEFDFINAVFWSSDSKNLAFYRFDESKVKEYGMPIYGDLYPTTYKYKYPKPGEENSVVSIHCYSSITKKITNIDIGKDTDIYIPRIKWTNNPNILSFYRLNRHQNKLDLLLSDVTTGDSKVIYTEENKCYIEINDNLTFLQDNKYFILTSEKDGYNHIYLYSTDGRESKQITKGNWDVAEIKGISEKTNTIFYISAEESPIDRALYSIKTDGSNKKKLSVNQGTNDATFNSDFTYYINSFTDANTPIKTSIFSSEGKEIKVLVENDALIDKMKTYNFSKLEFFKIKTLENIDLNAWMIKPYNFDSTKKYPVIMYVYGGPGSQTVENSWGYSNFLWFEMMAQKGYIVVSVDNRGTGFRGEEFKKCTYKELGKYETIDQIESAKYLGKLKYIDASRIGMFGWSYGGYMTLLCLTKGADVFKTGIAVAPVTNWRYYDNVYTERFMQTPNENADGYDLNSPINHLKLLKNKFLLVHGTADDNVHVQNSMELIMSLVKNQKQFDMMFYPNKNHSITGGLTRLHLFNKMTEYILNNL